MIGEAASRSSLELPGRQLELLQAVVATGTPVVLLVMNGRPLDLRWAAENVPAILDIWYPGTQGGAAVANLLFGDVSPGGKLPFTWPRTVGQVPMIYAHTISHEPENQGRRYWDEASTPLFPFGHGLSYGRVRVRRPRRSTGDSIAAGGTRHGLGRASPTPATATADEVVQLYLHQRLRHRVAAGPRAQGLPAGHPRRRGVARRVTFTARAGRAALLERGRPRLGARRVDLRRLGRRPDRYVRGVRSRQTLSVITRSPSARDGGRVGDAAGDHRELARPTASTGSPSTTKSTVAALGDERDLVLRVLVGLPRAPGLVAVDGDRQLLGVDGRAEDARAGPRSSR